MSVFKPAQLIGKSVFGLSRLNESDVVFKSSFDNYVIGIKAMASLSHTAPSQSSAILIGFVRNKCQI